MENTKSKPQEGDGKLLIEDISQIKQIALGEGAAVCEACGTELREGEPIIAFAFRPADAVTFEIGHVKCTDCRDEPSEYFTLGRRELVVDGRVGTCTDQATQSSWPVLIAPQPRAVSPTDTTSVHPLPGTTWFRDPIAESDVFVAVDCVPSGKPWQRPVMRADAARDSDHTSGSAQDTTPTTDSPHALDDSRRGGTH